MRHSRPRDRLVKAAASAQIAEFLGLNAAAVGVAVEMQPASPLIDIDALIALMDERIALALKQRDASAPYTSKQLPVGMKRERFVLVCARLHKQGDRRVMKVGRVWTAERSIFDQPRPYSIEDARDALKKALGK